MAFKLNKNGIYSISGTYKVYDESKVDNIEIAAINQPNGHAHGDTGGPSERDSSQLPRKQWRCRREFVLTSVAGCLGATNLWKFPFVAREYGGGGAFFIVYLLLTVSFAMPMCLVESILPQYSGMGTITVWNLAPVAKGIGISNVLLLILTLPSNCVPVAYNIFYVASSLMKSLPWSNCSDWWGADDECSHDIQKVNRENASRGFTSNVTSFNWTLSTSYLPTNEFFKKYVLQQDGSENISNIGSIPWQLFLCLLFTWLVIFLCISKGIRSVGKIVTITVPFVYICLFLLMFRMSVVDGALEGIAYFLNPNWSDFLNINLWVNVAQQLVFTLGVSSGAKAAFASHNVFHHKIQIDAWILWAATVCSNVMMCVLVYSTLGAMAKLTNTSIDQISVSESYGLSYIIYPEIVAETLKIPQLWSVMFFVTQFVMRIAHQFVMVLAIYIAVQDVWPSMRKHQTLWVLGICLVLFLLSLPAIAKGGYFVTKLINRYTYIWVGFVLLLCEEIGVCGIYGYRRYVSEMTYMAGLVPWLIYRMSWTFIAPIVTATVIVLYFINVGDGSNISIGVKGQPDPLWVTVVGWLLPTVCLLPIPIVAIYALITACIKGVIASGSQLRSVIPKLECERRLETHLQVET